MILSCRQLGLKAPLHVDATESIRRPSGCIVSKDVQVSDDIVLGLKDIEIPDLPPEERNSTLSPSNSGNHVITALAVQPSRAFNTCKAINTNRYVYSLPPPTVSELRDRLQILGLPSKIYQAPYYSKDSDIPESCKEYAGMTYRLKGGRGAVWLEEWSTTQFEVYKSNKNIELNPIGVGGWEYASHPPSAKEVRQSLELLPSILNIGKPKARSQVKSVTVPGFQTRNLLKAADRGSDSG